MRNESICRPFRDSKIRTHAVVPAINRGLTTDPNETKAGKVFSFRLKLCPGNPVEDAANFLLNRTKIPSMI
jgi:hypothetical protein